MCIRDSDHAAVNPAVFPVTEHFVEVALRSHAGQRFEPAEKRDAHVKAGNGRPVSYTHLDVYKRQDQYSPMDMPLGRRASLYIATHSTAELTAASVAEAVSSLSLIHIFSSFSVWVNMFL